MTPEVRGTTRATTALERARVSNRRNPSTSTSASAVATSTPPSPSGLIPARCSVLESPELLRVIFEYCQNNTLVQASLVNRLFEAASAPRIYRRVDLTVFGFHNDGRSSLSSCNGTPTPRQAKNISYAQALWIRTEDFNYDLSSCSFARVKVVECLHPHNYNEHKKLAEQIARIMVKCPDLRPSIVVDLNSVTLPFADGDLFTADGAGNRTDLVNRHTTRLVTTEFAAFELRVQYDKAVAAPRAGGRNPLFYAFYPNLLEVVIPIHWYQVDHDHLKTLLDLVEDGYRVVLGGYQEQNHDREIIRERLYSTGTGVQSNLDALIDKMVNRVQKMSLRQLFASPYGRYIQSDKAIEFDIGQEEEFYRKRAITMRHTLSNRWRE